ncbi:GTP-binding protein [Actinomadura viridis]|uniref:Signal recognition particle receptor subunit beta n=1 Tax=Actinomadura viridis TaxID=58110 RepID=A0A931DQH9_9ACTN|nr:ATP/GTP-binding protein [Actinomadura viridis]MBG6092893.1 signal recognition particle receptor subunit beta [Actinomadura viridis]
MDSNSSDRAADHRPAGAAGLPLRRTARDASKIVIVGGFGVGKTTMVGSISEIRPLSTEEIMTRAGIGIDDPSRVENKTTTTVAFDFGRISLDEQRVLYLFGAPGQERFWFLWDQLFSGSLGAVVLADTRRLKDCFYSLDRLEHHKMPFVVAVNRFDGPRPPLDRIRDALSLGDGVPLVECDARSRESCKSVLITLVRHLTRLHDPSLAQEVTP